MGRLIIRNSSDEIIGVIEHEAERSSSSGSSSPQPTPISNFVCGLLFAPLAFIGISVVADVILYVAFCFGTHHRPGDLPGTFDSLAFRCAGWIGFGTAVAVFWFGWFWSIRDSRGAGRLCFVILGTLVTGFCALIVFDSRAKIIPALIEMWRILCQIGSPGGFGPY